MKPEVREILERIRISENNIKIIEDTKLEIVPDEENVLKIKLSKDVAYDFYCDDFLENSMYKEVTLLDILYSSYSSGCFNKTYRYANYHKNRIEKNEFDSYTVPHITALICFILTKANDYKYSKLKTVADIVEPVPFQVYQTLLNNSNDKVEVYVEENGVTYAGHLSSIDIEKSMMGTIVLANISIISKSKEDYVLGEIQIEIQPKAFVSSVEEFGISLMTPEKKAEFTEAGRKYLYVTSKPNYLQYNGEAFSKGWMGDIRHRIDSRVMIDLNSFKLLNPRTSDSWFEGIFNNVTGIGNTVKEDMLWMCSPVVYGLSFGNKVWCRMNVKDISDIKFSENAFDELIIPQDNKDIFISSLTHEMPSLDSIAGKGAGKIFLLYGAPGVGKTMTAESVAEFLRKPLYYVSVGELGVSPEALEAALERVTKIAQSWDAIVLLDEVDVFAVKREGASIERNAMTAIFLRILERYSGVMFMTTNLLDNLDEAFISRSTAVIKYNDLTANDREKIWNGILDKVESLDTVKVSTELRDNVPQLAKHELNGRVIKNTIRLAYSLALSKNEELSIASINTALKLRQC